METRLLSLFRACDADRSGRIEKDEFLLMCRELRIQQTEVEDIFSRLDADRDGTVSLEEFLRGFQRVSTDLPSQENFSLAWEEFQSRLGEQAKFIPRMEQVATLYQNVSMTDARMVPQFERVLLNFTREIRLQNTEMEHLALAVKRAQDQAAMQLSEMEEEMDHRIQAAERSTRAEGVRRSEAALDELKLHYETQVCELQQKILKMQVAEEHHRSSSLKDESVALKKKNVELTLENQRLKQEVLESHTNVAFLQSELDSLKSDLTDQSINSERDEALMHCFSEERSNLVRQIEMLQSANRKLHDSNDSLRCALETSRQSGGLSPGDTITRHKSICSPYFNRCLHSLCLDEDLVPGEGRRRPSCDALALALCDPLHVRRRSCEVDSLADSCLDSGRSTLRGYDFEPEGSQHTLQSESPAGDASDTEVAPTRNTYTDAHTQDTTDLRDEAAFGLDSDSVLESKPPDAEKSKDCGPLGRKCLSAIFSEPDSQQLDLNPQPTDKAFRVVLAGDAAVGKSSFLLRLCKNEFSTNTKATLGVDFQMKTLVVDGEPTVLQLWDTAGQERFRSIAKSYFRRADGVLLLYDVTCEKSFLNVREWVDIIEDIAQDDVPIMLVGNKCDLRQEALQNGITCIPTSYGEKLAMTYSSLFCETSAKDGSNVIEAVLHLAREVAKHAHEEKKSSCVTNLGADGSKKSPNFHCCMG
ncbi:ras and EF-hand domain-containing protein isoform X2 [Denticeps clupeoides]|uniref:ras and EF-hand domain-containing protein isoform X2 n=1 Tax=Denticeps clupeoides TaxID=299321 RepID=UPI0010A49669|nr:ras and EF-hand domain-containing protein isoform X2 [Denticeps clupeoides]